MRQTRDLGKRLLAVFALLVSGLAFTPGAVAAAAGPTLTGPAQGAVLSYPVTDPVLSWQAVPNAQQYVIEASLYPDFPTGTDKTSTFITVNTSFTLTQAVKGETGQWILPNNPDNERPLTYYWRVRADQAGAAGAWSETRRLSVQWDASAKPTLIAPINQTITNQPEFQWTPTAGAARYELQIATSEAFTNKILDVVLLGTDYVPTITVEAGDFFWRVRAIDPVNKDFSLGPWSDLGTFTRTWSAALGGDPVMRPNNLRPDDGASGSLATCAGRSCTHFNVPANELIFTWDRVAGASHYEVMFSSDPAFLTPQKIDVCKTVRNYVTPGIVGDAYSLNWGDPAKVSDCYPDVVKAAVTAGANPIYVRVRAVAVSHTAEGKPKPVKERYSAWSNEGTLNAPDLTGLLTEVDVTSANTVGATAADQPAQLISPASGSSTADFPVLHWLPVSGADAYLVRIAMDVNFTNPALRYLSDTNTHDYYVSTGTYFIPQESMPDNTAGGSYYWYVLPCQTYDWDAKAIGGCVEDSQAINQPGRWRSVHKQAPVVTGLSESVVSPSAQPAERLSWTEQDATVVSGTMPPTGTKWYEVQLTNRSFESAATKLLQTDATAMVLSEESLLTQTDNLPPSDLYRWRVRAIDGGGLAGPWSASRSFTAPTSAGPTLVGSAGSVTPILSWHWLPGALHYVVEICAGTDGSFANSCKQSTTQYPHFEVDYWLAAGSYSWRVRAEMADGSKSGWSDRLGGAVPTLRTSGPPGVVVSGKTPTATTLSVSPTTGLRLGTTVTLVATVTPATSGTVVFRDSGHDLGTAALADGRARLVTSGVYGGAQKLVAEFTGSRTHSLSTSGAVTVKVADKVDPKLKSVSISGTARAPRVSWKASDIGGLRTAYLKVKPNKAGKNKWGSVKVAADRLRWSAPAMKSGRRLCVKLRVTDWAGHSSKTLSKCRVMK